jgi:hypothetical protein
MEKRRNDQLTSAEAFELELGPRRGVTLFKSDEARRAAWEANRGDLLSDLETETVRPWAFWAYDPDVPAELRDVEALAKRLRIPPGDLDWWTRRGFDELDRRRRAWLS